MSLLNKPSRALLLDLINQANATSLDATDIRFGPPTLNNGLRNTSVYVFANKAPYTGMQQLFYNRLDLGRALGNNTIVLDGWFYDIPTTLRYLNQKKDTRIATDEIVSMEYSNDPVPEITLTTTPHSYVYLPNTKARLIDGFSLFVKQLDDELSVFVDNIKGFKAGITW